MGERETSDVLVVFARDPAAGPVKTRLARAIGEEAASALYAAFVRDLRDRFAAAPFAVRWAVAPPDRGFAERFALDPASVFAQRGADLGARLRDALERMLRAGFARCAIIGSDAPQLRRDRVEQAFDALAGADVVLGPAEDGGYYLVAAKAPPDLFQGIAWSTGGVLAATLERASALQLRVSLLAPEFDVDEERDLAALRALLEGADARDDLRATAAALRAIDEVRTRSRHPDRRRS